MLKKVREKDEYIILANENGNTSSFEFLEMYVLGGREYAVLLEKGDNMVTIMELVENGCEEAYYTVEDDAVAEKVFRLFKKDFADEFDFD